MYRMNEEVPIVDIVIKRSDANVAMSSTVKLVALLIVYYLNFKADIQFFHLL